MLFIPGSPKASKHVLLYKIVEFRGSQPKDFLAAMPPVVSRRLALAREMMQGRQATQPAREPESGAGPERPAPERGRER